MYNRFSICSCAAQLCLMKEKGETERDPKLDGKTHLATLAGECTEVEASRWFAAHLALLVHLQ